MGGLIWLWQGASAPVVRLFGYGWLRRRERKQRANAMRAAILAYGSGMIR